MRAAILVVLERHESRCLDDDEDREAVADALVTELQLLPLPCPDSTAAAEPREDGARCPIP